MASFTKGGETAFYVRKFRISFKDGGFEIVYTFAIFKDHKLIKILTEKQIFQIATDYIDRVGKNELAVFPNYIDFGEGFLFKYQSKDFIINGNPKAFLYGDHIPFVVDKSSGEIFHPYRESNLDGEEVIQKFRKERKLNQKNL